MRAPTSKLVVAELWSTVLLDCYDDFVCGQPSAFGLECYWHQPLSEGPSGSSHALIPVGDATYRIVAEVVEASDHGWAVDAGIMMTCQGIRPPFARPGVWVQGEVHVQVDSGGTNLSGPCPGFVYDWQIEKIEFQTAPLIQQGCTLILDPSLLGWKEIAATHRYGDEADYLLHCRCLGGPAPRKVIGADEPVRFWTIFDSRSER